MHCRDLHLASGLLPSGKLQGPLEAVLPEVDAGAEPVVKIVARVQRLTPEQHPLHGLPVAAVVADDEPMVSEWRGIGHRNILRWAASLPNGGGRCLSPSACSSSRSSSTSASKAMWRSARLRLHPHPIPEQRVPRPEVAHLVPAVLLLAVKTVHNPRLWARRVVRRGPLERHPVRPRHLRRHQAAVRREHRHRLAIHIHIGVPDLHPPRRVRHHPDLRKNRLHPTVRVPARTLEAADLLRAPLLPNHIVVHIVEQIRLHRREPGVRPEDRALLRSKPRACRAPLPMGRAHICGSGLHHRSGRRSR